MRLGFLPGWAPTALFTVLLGLASAGCRKTARPTPSAPPSASAPASSAGEPRGPKEAPLASAQVEIPGGPWFAGSVPGDAGRIPDLEPVRFQVELGPYRIDRLPYPNDPAKPPLTGVTRDEARRRCADQNARLCTELEWERACKGPNSDEFATGPSWDVRCSASPARCASGFDALGLGAAIREWTASEVLEPGNSGNPKAALRGAAATAAVAEHRCAARRAFDPSSSAADLGFRCCSGAPNAAVVPEPKLGAIFEKTRVTAERLAKLLLQDPTTARLAKDIRFFKEPESAETVISRGPGDRKGFSFSVSPLLWNPVAGARFLLVTARSGENLSFVVAYHVLGDDSYRLAASFSMESEPGPIAFAYDEGIRPRLHFSTCWGCPGETGKILFRRPERAVIVQP